VNYLIAGGGTGGHIFPAVAIGEALLARVEGAQIRFVGTRYGLERDLIPGLGYALSTLPVRGYLGKGLAQKLALLWRIPASLILSLWLLLRYRPKVVVGVGGYASAPLLWMAALLRFPTMIQEQNAVPGLANRICSRVARLACCGFVEASAHLRCPTILTGNPVRRSFATGGAWSVDRKKVLVMGGSQGAHGLNQLLPAVLMQAIAPESGLELVHQCGRDHVAQVSEAYRDARFPVSVTAFIDDVGQAMGTALIAVCRAGASTIAEIRRVGLPAVLVPFPKAAHDHQTFNARSLAATGAAVMVAENDLAEAGPLFKKLLNNRAELERMAAAHGEPGPDSAALCAEIVVALQEKTEVSRLVEKYGTHVS